MQVLNNLKSLSSFFTVKQFQSLLRTWQIWDSTYSPSRAWFRKVTTYFSCISKESCVFSLHHPSTELFAHFSFQTSWSSRLWFDKEWGKFIVWVSNGSSSTSPRIYYSLISLQVLKQMLKSKIKCPKSDLKRCASVKLWKQLSFNDIWKMMILMRVLLVQRTKAENWTAKIKK